MGITCGAQVGGIDGEDNISFRANAEENNQEHNGREYSSDEVRPMPVAEKKERKKIMATKKKQEMKQK